MSKDNKGVKVATFQGCITRDMRDHIKPILTKKPDRLIIHVGTNSPRDSDTPSAQALNRARSSRFVSL